MTQRFSFEALDKTLRDILGYINEENKDRVFGGVTVLLGGDFRQILPVIPKGKRADVLNACINRSQLCKSCKVFTLTQSMRVNEYKADGNIDIRKQEINKWVLNVGNGILPAKIKESEEEPTWIKIPEEFVINSWNNPIEEIVNNTCWTVEQPYHL